MRLLLPAPDDTAALGAALGRLLAALPAPPALLLSGPLGAGKTSLVRGLVAALPGAAEAEVASPSFNIVNIYPTRPRVAHFDLYRTQGAAPEEFLELADDPACLVVAEWAENILRSDLPEEAFWLVWEPVPSGRALKISAWGKAAAALLAELAPALTQWKQGS